MPEKAKQRYVAFLDIAGFGSLVESTPLCEVLELVRTALSEAETAVSESADNPVLRTFLYGTLAPIKAPPKVHFFSFSDSFVFLSEDDSNDAFVFFLIATTILTRSLFAVRLPVVGTITFGEADFVTQPSRSPTGRVIDRATDHVVGKAINRAHDCAKNQNWMGVVIDEEKMSKDALEILDSVLFPNLFLEHDVSFKKPDPHVSRCRVLNWRFNLVLAKGVESLFRFPPDTPETQGALRKIARTMDFARTVETAGKHEQDEPLSRNWLVKVWGPIDEPTPS